MLCWSYWLLTIKIFLALLFPTGKLGDRGMGRKDTRSKYLLIPVSGCSLLEQLIAHCKDILFLSLLLFPTEKLWDSHRDRHRDWDRDRDKDRWNTRSKYLHFLVFRCSLLELLVAHYKDLFFPPLLFPTGKLVHTTPLAARSKRESPVTKMLRRTGEPKNPTKPPLNRISNMSVVKCFTLTPL